MDQRTDIRASLALFEQSFGTVGPCGIQAHSEQRRHGSCGPTARRVLRARKCLWRDVGDSLIDDLDFDSHAYVVGVYIDEELVSTLRVSHMTPDHRKGTSLKYFGDVLHPMLDQGMSFIDPSRFAASSALSEDTAGSSIHYASNCYDGIALLRGRPLPCICQRNAFCLLPPRVWLFQMAGPRSIATLAFQSCFVPKTRRTATKSPGAFLSSSRIPTSSGCCSQRLKRGFPRRFQFSQRPAMPMRCRARQLGTEPARARLKHFAANLPLPRPALLAIRKPYALTG